MIADIHDIISDLTAGNMVILIDDEMRENEGDVVVAASHINPQKINFMAQHCRGLICLAITQAHSERLNLPLMVQQNSSPYNTNFTVSIEAAKGVTTGISAEDRAKTVQVAVAPNVRPNDLVTPGHIFPVRAVEGGVLVRAGHTEAGCDLTRLAGLFPAAVICEIMDEDGSMARLPTLEKFADKHHLKIGTIESLIEHRMKNENLVVREHESTIQTAFGEFAMVIYRDIINHNLHTALVRGELSESQTALVRVAVNVTPLDGIAIESPAKSWSVLPALQKIAQAESGVLLMLSEEQVGHNQRLQQKMALEATDAASETEGETNPHHLRHYGLGAQILRDLGCGQIRLLANPVRLPSMHGFGLTIEEFISPN